MTTATLPPEAAAAATARPLTPWRRLGGLVRPDRADVLALVAFAVAISVMLLAVPISVQALVNFVALGGAMQPLIVVAMLLLLGLGIAGVLAALQNWTVELLQRRLFARMVADLAGRLPRVRYSRFDTSHGPELVNRFFDVVTIQKTGSFLLLDGLSVLLSVLVGLIVLAFYHPLLLAFDVVLLAIIALIVLGPLRKGARTAIVESKAKYRVVGWFEEVARTPRAFRAGGAEHWVRQEADRLACDYLDARARHYRVLFAQIVSALGLQAVASVTLLGLGGVLVMQGDLTLGQLVAAEVIVTLVVSSVAKLGKHLESYYDLMAATDKVGQLLDLETEATGELVDEVDATEEPGATLEIQHLGWQSPRGELLFDGLDLTLKAGERLAVTGSSGAGKSILLEMIWRLRRPSRGALRVDGVDLRDHDPTALRCITALLGSDVDIVIGSVRDNVTLGRPGVIDSVVRDVLKRVGLLERVSLLPDGLDTDLLAGGQPLSGSETRLLLLARALAGRPRLLLVHDLFEDLEPDRRRALLDTLLDPSDGMTVVIATTARDVIDHCDRTLDLDLHRSRSPDAGTATEANPS